MAGLGRESESVVCPHRLCAEEAAHPVFDGEEASLEGGHENRPVELFELSAERALWILVEDHLVTCGGVAKT